MCPASPKGFGEKFGHSRSVGLNLGEVLRGDRIAISDYELFMGQDQTCKKLCDQKVDKGAVNRAYELIKDNYNVEWYVARTPGRWKRGQ